MANAIKHISVQRGYDVTGYTLCSFGGAGGQHACRVADALGMSRVFIHPLAGVLSAYGMGLADVRALRQQAVEARLSDASLDATRERVFGARGRGARATSRSRASRPRASAASARCISSTKAPTRRSPCRCAPKGRPRARTNRPARRRNGRSGIVWRLRARFRHRARRLRAPLSPAVRLPDARQGAGDRGDRHRGDRHRARHARRAPRVRAAAARARRAAPPARLHAGVVAGRRGLRARGPASRRCDRRTGDHPRAQRDDGAGTGLAGDADRARSSGPRHASCRFAGRMRSARAPIR